MNRNGLAQSPALALSAIGLVCLLNGCGETTSGDYQEYVATSGSAVDSTSAAANSQLGQEPPAATINSNDTADSADPQERQPVAVKFLPEKQVAEKKPGAVDDLTTENQPDRPDSKPANESVTVAAASIPAKSFSPRQTELVPAVAPTPANSGNSPVPRIVQVLVKDRTFKKEGPQDAIRVSYDDIDLLKILNMEPVTPNAPDLMPGWLKDLDGRRIRIRGFMYPAFQETGLEAFLLARDNQICCFGRNPKIYDLFRVRMRRSETTRYIQNRPFDVVGVFHIRPEIEDEKIFQLYEIDDALVFDK